MGEIELPPGYLPLQVPIEVHFTQRVAVDVSLRTADGLPLGEPVRLSVHSNAYGQVLFFITLSVGAVLVALAGRRLWHRFRGQPDRADLDRPDPLDTALAHGDESDATLARAKSGRNEHHRPACRAGAATVRPGRGPMGRPPMPPRPVPAAARHAGLPGHPPPPRRVPPPPPRQRIPRGPAPRRRAGRPELSDAAVVSRSWGMAFATLVSRITGFIRIVLLAAILGAALSSAFTVANQLPNLVAALVLEATFTAIFVPVLARAERDDPDGGTAFVRRLVTLATALLLVATVVSVAAAPLLVRLMLGSDPQVNRSLTTAFAYLLLPQVIFYGLSSVFMAILNTRNVFGPPAWAPVVNNVVAIATLVLYLVVPGELSVDPVEMGNAKLLVLGIGTTLGVFAQTAVLLVAIRKERVSLRPLWGLDDRLRRFGGMAAAMVLYVLISQVGLVVGNQIASAAAASGPAIYNYTWLVLMLPFGMIGVTVLTVVMPRLSRNAAADDNRAVLADLSLGDAADDGDADSHRGVHDRRGPGDRQRAVRVRKLRRRRRRLPGHGDHAVGVHPDPIRAGIAAASGLLRPRTAVDADHRDHRHHRGEDRRVAGRAPPDR